MGYSIEMTMKTIFEEHPHFDTFIYAFAPNSYERRQKYCLEKNLELMTNLTRMFWERWKFEMSGQLIVYSNVDTDWTQLQSTIQSLSIEGQKYNIQVCQLPVTDGPPSFVSNPALGLTPQPLSIRITSVTDSYIFEIVNYLQVYQKIDFDEEMRLL